MNKILPVIFTLAVILTLADCSNTSAKYRDISSGKSDVSKNNSTDEHNKSQTDSAKETKTMKTINIRVTDKTFTATLEDNDTAKALLNSCR